MKFKSALVTQVSGSIGGMTGSRNAGGMYFRARSMPTNPNTPAQQAIREIFGQLTNAWALLTPVQRDAWNVYASNVPLPDRLGEQRNVSGLNHFIRSNTPRVQAELAIISAAPTVFNIGPTPVAVNTPTFDDADNAQLTVDVGTPGMAGTVLAYASRPQTPTINYFRGPYQFIEKTAFVSPGSADVSSDGHTPWHQTIGQKMFMRLQTSFADGRLSADLQVEGFVASGA